MIVNERSEKFLEERYYMRGENWERLCKRVAWAHATSDQEAEAFFEMIYSMDALPSSPILMNSGAERGHLSACNLIPVPDDMSGIFDSMKTAGMIQKFGGGTGFNFSKLRPEGDAIASTGGTSSGVIAFLQMFNAISLAIRQGGKRRGANMGVLALWHPDILDWIKVKHDPELLKAFNISVGVPDELFTLAQGNEEEGFYHFINPRTGLNHGGRSARGLERRIAREIWHGGEPGILFWDTIQKANATPWLGNLHGLNPCVAGDTAVFDCGTWRLRKITAMENAQHSGRKPVYWLDTVEGFRLGVTKDHRIMTESGWVQAGDLKPDDKIVIQGPAEPYDLDFEGSLEKGQLCGWFVGDGHISYEKGKTPRGVLQFYNFDKGSSAKTIADAAKELGIRANMYKSTTNGSLILKSTEIYKMLCDYGIETKEAFWGVLLETPDLFRAGFLGALFAADGSVQGSPDKGWSVRLAQSGTNGMNLLRVVQLMLLNFGIYSVIYQNRRDEHDKMMPDGRGGTRLYHCKAQHELVITGVSMCQFHVRVGFMHEQKQRRLGEAIKSYSRGPYKEKHLVRFESLTLRGTEEVYDLVGMPDNQFIANGMVVHNCGEIPLYNYESCVLGSVNLYNHLTPEFDVDHKKLDKTVATMVLLLNRVLDNNKYPIPEMHEAAQKTRKIGVGVMGFADMLYRMQVDYGSSDCMRVIDDVMGHIRATAQEVSLELARKDGPYPAWQEGAPPFRNANLIAIAPTGSIGYIADVSSGIEPAFDMVYQMNREDHAPVYFMNRALRDEATELVGTVEGLAERIVESGREWLQEMKPWYLTAMDVSPIWHIDVQARFQSYVDQAISKTINLPEETTVDEISKLIRYAHSQGLKGLTMFRKGCYREAFLEVPKCQECGDKLIQQDGCSRCRSCGWEACAIT